MPEQTRSPPRFQPEEAERVFRRAAELQSSAVPAAHTTALTADEMRSIATEAGLSAEHLEQAIRETLRSPGVALSPDHRREMHLDRVVDREISVQEQEGLVRVLMNLFGDGETQLMGSTVTW